MAVTLYDAFMHHLPMKHTYPSVVPATEEDVFTADVYVTEISITNKSSSATTLTMKDKQSTPRELVPTTTINANSVHEFRFDGRFCPGGLTWQAGAADSLVVYVRGRSSG